MAKTALTAGNSATLTLAATDRIFLNGASTASARIESVSIPGADNRKVLASHSGGRRSYGPFGVGDVKLSAVGGDITYEQGTSATEPGYIKAIVSPDAPLDADGNEDGMIYIQTAA